MNLRTTTIAFLPLLCTLMAKASPFQQRDTGDLQKDMIKIPLGCYEDREDARLLPERPKTFIAADQMSNTACNAACVIEGFSYAGVGNGRFTCARLADWWMHAHLGSCR
jgi:hypothetical protein